MPTKSTYGQTVTVCYKDGLDFGLGSGGPFTSRRSSLDEKLNNSSNYGPSGTSPVDFNAVSLGSGAITLANLISNGCHILDIGLSNTGGGEGNTLSDYTTAEVNDIKAWSSAAIDRFILGFQGAARVIEGTAYFGTGTLNDNPNSLSSSGNQLFNGPFGSSNSFNQGGTYQGVYGAFPASATVIVEDANGDPTGLIDCNSGNVYLADVDIVSELGGMSSGSSITTNSDIFYANLMHGMGQLVLQNVPSACTFFDCTAGIEKPILNINTIDNICPNAGADLTTVTVSNIPTNTVVTWHTATPATDMNQVLDPTSVPPGTYYAAFYSASSDCYAGSGQATEDIDVTNTSICCSAGTAAPVGLPATASNTCPATTFDLTSLNASISNQPGSTSITWHDGTPATTANKLTPAQATAQPAGTYYAAFFDATNDCYSGTSGDATTSVTVTINAACVENTTALCSDGIDNDGDGQIDCNDGDCATAVVCTTPPSTCGTPNTNGFIEDGVLSGTESTAIKTDGGWIISGVDLDGSGNNQITLESIYSLYSFPAGVTVNHLGLASDGSAIMIGSNGVIYTVGEADILSPSASSGNESDFGAAALALPAGVTESDIDYIKVSKGVVAILTNSGEIYVTGFRISDLSSTFNEDTWNQLMLPGGIAAAKIEVERGVSIFIYGSDGNFYTMGKVVYLGNGTTKQQINSSATATLMNSPNLAGETVVQIQLGFNDPNYYVLTSDGRIHVMGGNGFGELGIGTTTEQSSWTTATGVNDAQFIDANHGDNGTEASGYINAAGELFFSGANRSNALTDGISSSTSTYLMASGINSGVLGFAMGGRVTPYLSKDINGDYLICQTGKGTTGAFGDGTLSNRTQYECNLIPGNPLTAANAGLPCADVNICDAGTTAPSLTTTAISNTCPATTADLTTSTATNTPAGTTLTWHTGTPATTANKLTPAQAAAQPAGTYYAAFYDATNDCYSGTSGDGSATTSVNVTINASCTNPIILNEVNVCTGRIEIYNTGSTTVDVSGYYLCGNSFQYDQVGGGGDVTINSGTTMLAAGAYLDITWADLNTTAGELGLYENNTGFGDASNMVDYIQYNVGNQARSAVAVTAGVWDNAANFVTSPTGAGCNSIGVDNSLTPTEGADTDSGSWCTSALSPSSANGACITCDAGTTAPSLSSTAIFNTCPATTADLSSITATTPAGATLTWHTGTPATTANKLTPAQAAAQPAGTYYAAFYDATNDCYSGTSGDATTSVTVTIACCVAATDLGYTAPGAYDISTAVFAHGQSVSETEGITFNTDGTKMFVSDVNAQEFNLSTPWDISTASGSVSITDAKGKDDLKFTPDGLTVYFAEGEKIRQYNMTTAFSFATATFVQEFIIPTPGGNFAFSNDGTILFTMESNKEIVYQVNLSTPYDMSTAGGGSANFNFAAQASESWGFDFNDIGTKLFILGKNQETIFEYNLSTPYDLNTVSYAGAAETFNFSAQTSSEERGSSFGDNGRYYYVGLEGGGLLQFNLGNGCFNEATISDGSITAGESMSINLENGTETFINAGGTLTAGTHYDITNLPSGLSSSVSVSADGKTATLVLSGNALAHADANDLSDISITWLDTAFTGGNASCVNGSSGGTGICIDFSGAFVCNAGTVVPTLSTSALSNICPATTADLTSITASNLPASTTLTWHIGTPANTTNKIITPAAVGAGTYYAAFYDATNDCYSGVLGDGTATTSVTVTIITDCDGDGVPTPTDTDDTDPCTPAQAAGYTGYDATNAVWAAADCDGDGVTNGDEDDPAGGGSTDPYGACAFNASEITGAVTAVTDCDGDGTPTSTDPDDADPCTPAQAMGYTAYDATNPTWAAADCDGDGVTNGDEDDPAGGGFTDPYSACAFNTGEITGTVTADPDCDGDGTPTSTDPDDADPCTPAQAMGYTAYDATNAVWAAADCDGDGVTNGDEDDVAGGGFTDPYSACAFNTGEITGTVSSTGDCDGDGVTNADEINNGPGDPQTDPTDLCDYNIAEQGTPDAAWNAADCDSDGNENGTDPNPLVPTAVDDTGSASIGSTAIIDILGNDDFLPNDGNTITEVPGGTAMGAIVFDHVTGELDYTPTAVELGTDVTVIYEVCQGTVCDQATVTVSVIATPAAPDLFPNFTFSGQTFIPGQSKDVVININEISGIATTGQIEFFVPTSSGFTYTFDAVQTSATVLVPVAVNNGDWTMTTTVAGLLFTSNTVIPGNDRSRIALSATANIAGTKANLTANITPNSGGETRTGNNTSVLSKSVQN